MNRRQLRKHKNKNFNSGRVGDLMQGACEEVCSCDECWDAYGKGEIILEMMAQMDGKKWEHPFVWTAYGANHEPLQGYSEYLDRTYEGAMKQFRREYGNDSSISYLVKDIFDLREMYLEFESEVN